MKDFDYWKKLHESDKLEEFSSDEQGLLWLKVKSIVRKKTHLRVCHRERDRTERDFIKESIL